MKKSITSYFSKGFLLANKSLDLYLIGVGLSIFGILAGLFNGSPIATLLQIIASVLGFFSFGFGMSLPLLLTNKQQRKHSDLRSVWSIITKNTKRMILPVIVMSVLVIVLFFAVLLWFLSMSNTTSGQEINATLISFSQQLPYLTPLFIVLGIPFAFFAFTSIYFSVENEGFFTSIKKSIAFGFKHLHFVGVLILLGAVHSILIALVKIPIDNHLGQFVLMTITQYTSLVITASTLLFFQSRRGS